MGEGYTKLPLVAGGFQRLGGSASCRRCSRRCAPRRFYTFRIQQIVVLGAEAQGDESAGVGQNFGLPAVVILILDHGGFSALIPDAGRRALEVIFPDQRFLDLAGALFVYFLLP